MTTRLIPRWHCWALLALVAVDSVPAYAWDLAIKMGGASGTVSRAGAVSLPFGGTTLAGAMVFDNSASVTSYAQVQLLVDTLARQITRKGFQAGVSWHLLGSSQRFATGHETITVVDRSPYDLSLVSRFDFNSYSASDVTNSTKRVTGDTFGINVGGEYRQDLSETQAVGIEAMTRAVSVSASAERLTESAIEFAVFWRFTY